MTKINIKSKNQSGGITAQNVNYNPAVNHNVLNGKPESFAKRVFWWIFGIAGVISAVIATIKIFMGD